MLQRSCEVADRFDICRALGGKLTGAVPEANGLVDEAGLRVMMGQDLRFRLGRLRELFLQHSRNLLMVLLSGTFQ